MTWMLLPVSMSASYVSALVNSWRLVASGWPYINRSASASAASARLPTGRSIPVPAGGSPTTTPLTVADGKVIRVLEMALEEIREHVIEHPEHGRGRVIDIAGESTLQLMTRWEDGSVVWITLDTDCEGDEDGD